MNDILAWLVDAGDMVGAYGTLIAVLVGLGVVALVMVPLCRPRIEAEAPIDEPDGAPVPAPPSPAQGLPVLVVDDSAVVRARLQRLLESVGYRVVLAQDGVEAEACLAQQRFAVLITDLEMPRMDGFQLIAAVRRNIETENLPMIAITGHDDLHARVRDCEGVFGIFQKPWNDRELLRRVDALAQIARTQPAR